MLKRKQKKRKKSKKKRRIVDEDDSGRSSGEGATIRRSRLSADEEVMRSEHVRMSDALHLKDLVDEEHRTKVAQKRNQERIGARVEKIWNFIELCKCVASTDIVPVAPVREGGTEPLLYVRKEAEDWERLHCMSSYRPPRLRDAILKMKEEGSDTIDLSMLDWPALFEKMMPLAVFDTIAEGLSRVRLHPQHARVRDGDRKRRRGGGRKGAGVSGKDLRLLTLAHMELAVSDTSKLSTQWFLNCKECKRLKAGGC